MQRRPPAFERVRRDLEAGRLWKARDRLHGLLRWDSTNKEVLDTLGDISFRMADLPAAGRYWFLTERSDEKAQEALEALHERHGRSAIELIRFLPVRAPIDAYPPEVQARLRELQARARKEGFHWDPRRRPSGTQPESTRRSRLVDELVGPLIVVLLVGVWLVGVVTVVILIGRLFR